MKPSRTPPRRPARQSPDYADPAYWRGTIKMSLSKFFVLCVLHKKAMHGYEVVQAVERTTDGCCSPTEGTVYPMLNEFEAGGFLTAHTDIVQGRARKVYAITQKGRDAFQTAVDAWMEATDCIVAGRAAAGVTVQSQGKTKCCPE